MIKLLKFYNENYGIVYSDNIFITSNGGTDWITGNNLQYWISDTEFVPEHPERIWLSDLSNLYYSNDSGKTLITVQLSIEDLDIRDIHFVNENVGWVMCDDGRIFKTTNGGITSNEKAMELPLEFKLYQNYPNPFNPTTTISYSLPEHTHVSIKVFGLLGRQVTELVNEVKQPGNHEVIFNGSELSSGVYFYSIKSDNFTDTKKFVLLK